ncbi:pyocin knob domain-containing protein [Paenibacillus sp. M2]|uniref:pyocin knob domain-containing protein n=1 Tax=Paenibacillus sp. M2 TaxID=3341793 RepID=UPI003989D2EE
MANRYTNLIGSRKISEDFNNINIGFDRVQAEMDTKGTPQDAQTKADAAKQAAIDAAAAALTSHKQRGADEHPTAKGNAAGFMSAADKLKSDASTSAVTPDTLMQRDAAGRAKVTAPVAADDIARKAETDAVQTNLESHAADTDIHVTADDHAKLDGIAEGAEVNQNVFSKVNDVEASSKSDTLQLTGGTGITVTTDPATKRVIVTSTGTATPGAHASSHVTGGSDVIPDAVTDGASGLMSGVDAKFVRQDGETKVGAQAKADTAKQTAIDASLPRTGGALTGPLRISSWGEISASTGGYVLYGHNCYLDATGVVYRYRSTHATMGARGIVFRLGAGLQGAWMFDMGAIATTAGAAFTPTLKRMLNMDDFTEILAKTVSKENGYASDANNVDPGFHFLRADSTNSPDGDWATMLNVGGAITGRDFQIAQTWNVERLPYTIRRKKGTDWSSWERLLTQPFNNTWVDLPLLNNWVPYDTSTYRVGVMRYADGLTIISGTVKNGINSGILGNIGGVALLPKKVVIGNYYSRNSDSTIHASGVLELFANGDIRFGIGQPAQNGALQFVIVYNEREVI